MKALTDLSAFIESESFNILDEETRKNVVLKLRETIDDICNQYGVSDNKKEDSTDNRWYPRSPDLYLGLSPIEVNNMPSDREIRWILGGDIQGLIPLIRSNGKYGLFRPSFMGMGMGVDKYYSTKNPFRFDDVRICVPPPAYGGYDGFLATLENKEWSVWHVDINSHPLRMVCGCNSFKEAKSEMENILGKPSPFPWMTFDVFDEFNSSLWNMPAMSSNADLVVIFPDGTVFDDNKAISTFVKTIQKIGFDEVARVGIMFKGYNLVDTRKRTDKGKVWQKQVGKYFIYSYLSNSEKLKCLTKINNYYNLGLKIVAK